MNWIFLFLFLTVAVILWSRVQGLEARASSLNREPEQVIDPTDPFVQRAMAELDEMDDVLGILPPKPVETVGPFGLKPDWEMMDTMTMRNVTSIERGGIRFIPKPGPPY